MLLGFFLVSYSFWMHWVWCCHDKQRLYYHNKKAGFFAFLTLRISEDLDPSSNMDFHKCEDSKSHLDESRQKRFLLLKLSVAKGAFRNTISLNTWSHCRPATNKKKKKCKIKKKLYFKISNLIFYSTVLFKGSFNYVYLKSLILLKWKWYIYFQSKGSDISGKNLEEDSFTHE